jgi:hypothetical protein
MPFHVFLSHSSADKPAGRNIEGETLTPAAKNPLSGIQGDCLEIEAELSFDEPTVCDLIIRASSDQAECTTITYHSAERILTVDGSRSSLDPDVDRPTISGPLGPDHQGVVRFRVFLDRSVLEVFAADRACVTHRLYPTREDSLGLGYDALKEKGFRIPEDVSVIGFDNQELLAAHSRPRLTGSDSVFRDGFMGGRPIDGCRAEQKHPPWEPPPCRKPRPTLSFDNEDLNNEQFIMLDPVRQLPILLCQTMRK